jgi:putative transposase
MKRITIAGLPHHVIQRGLNGRKTFLNDDDYTTYLNIITESCHNNGVEIWTYCLMPDHVHLIAVPIEKDSLTKCLRSAHIRYTKYINRRLNTSGQFWQGRYSSHLLDEEYLIACARYIEINPVKRDYVNMPEEWKWSSAWAHIKKTDDRLVMVSPMLERVKKSWQKFLLETRPDDEPDLFYSHEKSGLPLGNKTFLSMVKEKSQE